MPLVIIALDLDDHYLDNPTDLVRSIEARLRDEAGYLDDGEPISPERVRVAVPQPKLRHVMDGLLDGAQVGTDSWREEESSTTTTPSWGPWGSAGREGN